MSKLTALNEKVGQPGTRDVLQLPLLGSLVAVAFDPNPGFGVCRVYVIDFPLVVVQDAVEALLGALDPDLHL